MGEYLPVVLLYSLNTSISSVDNTISLKPKSVSSAISEAKKPTNFVPGAVLLVKVVTNVPSGKTETGVVIPEPLDKPLTLKSPLTSNSSVGEVVPIPTCACKKIEKKNTIKRQLVLITNIKIFLNGLKQNLSVKFR